MDDDEDEPADVRWLNDAEFDDWVTICALLLTLPATLEAQLQRDAGISLFSYLIMARLSEAPERTMQMSELAVTTQGSLSKLSHAVATLERRDWVQRVTVSGSPRHTLARLTDAGMTIVRSAAPGHVNTVRHNIIDVLDPDQRSIMAKGAGAVLDVLGVPRPPGAAAREQR